MNDDLRNLTREPHFFRFWLPYLFQRIDHPSHAHVFLPLNRNYKPLGVTSSEWVEYDNYTLSHGVFFARDPSTFSGIWHGTVKEGDSQLWLYNDGPASRLDYFVRFEQLMSKMIKVMDGRV